MIKVSIIMPVYNSGKYLKTAVESILNQRLKEFELILVDDGSIDGSSERCDEYARKDERIVVIHQKNGGICAARNAALKVARGEFIAFSDHDDIWYPNKIEESLKILKEKNVDLVYCDAKQIDENGKILHESYLRYKNMPILNEKYKKDILPFSRHIAIGCSQLLTKQVRDLMIPFSKNTIAHDWHSLYIANKLKGVYCIDKTLFEYRLHGNNAFGGRNFKQNIKIWKEKDGNNYKSYLKYRYRAITETYLAGVLMCKDYNSEQNKEESCLQKIKKSIL